MTTTSSPPPAPPAPPVPPVPPAGDQARVSIRVDVPPAVAFQIFTEDIDAWWRRGLAYRVAGAGRGILHLEPRIGGRLLESYDGADGRRVFASGTVTAWEPPGRLVFEWRSVTFVPGQRTEVEVTFAPTGRATLVTVTHRGWASIPADHTVRHGRDVAAFVRTMGLWWMELLRGLAEHADPSQRAAP